VSPPIARRLRSPCLAALLLLGLAACGEEAPVAPTGSTGTLAAPPVRPTVLPSDVVPCGEVTEVTLWAGQDIDVGTVTVANDEDHLYVTYAVTGGWTLRSTHLEVATSLADVPTNDAGNPVVGRFTHRDTHSGVTAFTYTIARSDLGGEAGDELVVAAHADVYETAMERSEGAWGAGSRFVEDGNWATYSGHGVQACDAVLAPDELCSSHTDAAVATFADANLEAEVREELAVGPDAELTCGLLDTIELLNAFGAGITDVAGIQNLTSVKQLFISNNDISDLGPLSGMGTVETLFVGSNPISDLGPLSDLSSLLLLSANNSDITDLSPLSGLTSLQGLHLPGNQISDLGPLSGLSDLESLTVAFNQIADLTPLANLTSLRVLGIQINEVTDLTPLRNLTELTNLQAGNNDIQDVTVLQNLTNLSRLGLFGNEIADVTPLEKLTGLTRLNLGSNDITSIAPLDGLTELTFLMVSGNTLGSIDPVAGLTKLEDLRLQGTSTTSVAAVDDLLALTNLDLRENPDLSDASPLLSNADMGGLGTGDRVDLRSTDVSCSDIEMLETNYGVTVKSDCP